MTQAMRQMPAMRMPDASDPAALFDGLSLGYRMTLLTDASSSRTQDIHQANIRDIRDAGMACMTVDEYLGRLPV